MNRIITILCCFFILNIAKAQEDSTKIEDRKDSTRVVDSKRDTTRIMLGKKEIKIIESEDGTEVKIRRSDDPDGKEEKIFSEKSGKSHDIEINRKKGHSKGFKGHWDGVSFGYNGFTDKAGSMSLSSPDNSFMSLNNNPTRSMNINANFGHVNQKIIGNCFGLVTGLGFEFNNYFFENNNTILKDNTGRIISYSYDSVGIKLDKSKLALLYFTIPVMFEFQIPVNGSNSKKLWIAGGITGSIKISSHTKVVYHENGHKQKDKNKDDFNIAVLRYGFTGRVGYDDFYVYGNYYPVQFFEKNRGPELYPFSVGIGFHFD
jgi:hypothetical protein